MSRLYTLWVGVCVSGIERLRDNLESGKGLDALGVSVDSEHIEAHRLREWAALADGDDVAIVDSECWGCVCREVLVSFLITSVFRDKLQVFSSHDYRRMSAPFVPNSTARSSSREGIRGHTNGSCHLGGYDRACQDTSPDGDVADKGTLLVNVVAIDGFTRRLEPKTNLLEPSLWLSTGLLCLLRVEEDVRLFLEGTLRLHEKFTGHDESCLCLTVDVL